MYSLEKVTNALKLFQNGKNTSVIARELKIPRSTIKDWVGKFKEGDYKVYKVNRNQPPNWFARVSQLAEESDLKSDSCEFESHREYLECYLYMLGLYLGDGHITKEKRTYRLRIFQNKLHTKRIDLCIKCLKILFPCNSVNIVNRPGCTVVIIRNNYLPIMFPQHGPGKKHNRKIELLDWQIKYAKLSPKPLIRGLLHSDGCRFLSNKKYLYYQFTNKSEDIKDIFCLVCDLLSLKYTRPNHKNIYVRNKDSVNILESFCPIR